MSPRPIRPIGTRSALLLTAGLLLLDGRAAIAAEVTAPPDPQGIYGGVKATTCQWPTTVSVDTGPAYCTGTLVHPEVIVYAAHCVHGPSAAGVYFGEWDESSEDGAWVDVAFCKAHPEFGSPVGNNDIAFCKLSTPVIGPPPTPPLMGCEAEVLVEGWDVVIAGFGNADDGTTGYKRYAQTTLGPPTPGLPHAVQIGGGGVGACVGDSGGPAYVQLDDGTWRAFGVVSGGSSCGNDGIFMLMHPYVDWLEAEAGVDITPCHDADGTWAPSPECGGFAVDPFATDLTWENGCAGELSGPSSTCGPPHEALDEDPPSVQIVAPADGDLHAEPVTLAVSIVAEDEDGSGVKAVRLLVDGDEQPGSDTTPPYELTVSLSEGVTELVAIAEDHAGNVGVSPPVLVHVDASEDPSDGTTSEGNTEDDGGATGEAASGEPAVDDGESGCVCRAHPNAEPRWPLLAWAAIVVGVRRRGGRALGACTR